MPFAGKRQDSIIPQTCNDFSMVQPNLSALTRTKGSSPLYNTLRLSAEYLSGRSRSYILQVLALLSLKSDTASSFWR